MSRRPFIATLFLEPSDDSDAPNHWRFQCLELGLESIGCVFSDTMHYGLDKVRERLAEVVEQGEDLDRLRAPQEDWDRALEVSRSSKPHGYLRVPFEWPSPKEKSIVEYVSAQEEFLPVFYKLPFQPRRVLFEGNDPPFIVTELAAGPTGDERCLERSKEAFLPRPNFGGSRRLGYSEIARQMFPIQPMPDCALPAYLPFNEDAQDSSDKSTVQVAGRSLRENLERELDEIILGKLEEAVKPEKPARTVTRFPCMVLPDKFGDLIVVRYPKGERVEGRFVDSYTGWDKGSAWDDLVHHNPIEGVPEGDNPWRKDHTDTHWVWRCEP